MLSGSFSLKHQNLWYWGAFIHPDMKAPQGVQPVPWKMRLRMLVRIQIEILNGGEIWVHCKPKITIWIFKGRYRGIRIQSNLNLNLYREIQRKLGFSILTSWLKSPQHSGFRLGFRQAFGVSSSTGRAVLDPPTWYSPFRGRWDSKCWIEW